MLGLLKSADRHIGGLTAVTVPYDSKDLDNANNNNNNNNDINGSAPLVRSPGAAAAAAPAVNGASAAASAAVDMQRPRALRVNFSRLLARCEAMQAAHIAESMRPSYVRVSSRHPLHTAADGLMNGVVC